MSIEDKIGHLIWKEQQKELKDLVSNMMPYVLYGADGNPLILTTPDRNFKLTFEKLFERMIRDDDEMCSELFDIAAEQLESLAKKLRAASAKWAKKHPDCM